MQQKSTYRFMDGMKDSIPIFLGYISVSFGFGVLAVRGGLTVLQAVFISLTNVTSAGQLEGLSLMTAGAALIEVILAELVINIRYSLMSISLTQKLDPDFGTGARLICGFSVTDEVFGVASSKAGSIGKHYFLGLIVLPVFGWVLGTAMGAVAGSVLPEMVRACLGLMLYAMFIAIVVPPSMQNKAVLFAVSVSAALSLIFTLVPFFSFMTAGFSVVVCALIASVPAAILFPIKEEA